MDYNWFLWQGKDFFATYCPFDMVYFVKIEFFIIKSVVNKYKNLLK